MNTIPLASHNLSSVGLTWESILATVVYALLGVVLLMAFTWAVNKAFGLNLRRELLEDQNVGLGVALAGTAIAVAIIVSATITG
ncbi:MULTISPECIES: DUF350 domain-containing protein [Actinomyces]|uniref:DUF350 domain-containing protein n=1 Tax=Actinomyces marmotae TaxID=2737173 RepID=A0A6M8B6A3_9ACTO|nr:MULTISPECIES: DUF350 domain-containing protein [Actinomyces]QKD78971.1 DUF350 domain-containing protein [Actinomyces marmotae]